MVLPNVLTALIVLVGGAGLTWLVALLFVKVLKWPNKKTVRRFDRQLKRDLGYADPTFWCWTLGLFVPAFIGLGIAVALNPPSTSRPNYGGSVVEVRECDRGPMTLWWLYRCEVAVRFDPEPVRREVDLPSAPARPVSLRMHAQRPLRTGDPVLWEAAIRTDETATYALPFERARPSVLVGAAAGWLPALIGSVLAGRWWTRSRPRHPIDEKSIRTLLREIRELKRGRE